MSAKNTTVKNKKVGDDLTRNKDEPWDPHAFAANLGLGLKDFISGSEVKKKVRQSITAIGDAFVGGQTQNILTLERQSMKDKYNVGKQLGEGGFGLVYEVVNKKTKVTWACKEQSKDRIVHEGMEKCVLNEYLIMQHLNNHDNIIKMEAAIEGRHHVYFILDHCDGGDVLESIIDHFDQKGVYTEADAARVMKDMLTAVSYCHSHGVVHRDIKPENFLWKGKGDSAVLKLTDFGLSQVMFKSKEMLKSSCGTPNYMPPEMWTGKRYGKNVDVWSLGVSMALMLTGAFPFDGETEQELADLIVKKELNFDEPPLLGLSAVAKDLLSKMLNKDGEKRWSVAECLKHPWINGHAPNESLDDSVNKGIRAMVELSTFHKAILRMMVVLASDDEIQGMVKTFQLMDTDKSGNISLTELKEWMTSQSYGAISTQEIENMFKVMDDDKDGTLNVEEFVVMAMGLRSTAKKVSVSNLFDKIDTDHNGFITKEEAKEVFEAAGLTGDYFWKNADTDGDGKVSLQEFEDFVVSDDKNLLSAILETRAEGAARENMLGPVAE